MTKSKMGEKQSLYFPLEMMEEIRAEAIRQDRSMSWIMQRAWEIARETLRKIPTTSQAIDAKEKRR